MRRRWACAVALLAASVAGDPQRSALARLADAVGSQVTDASPELPVAVYVRSESQDLARSFATLLAAALARRKLAPSALEAPTAAAAEASARRAGARSLVRISLVLSNGVLHARGDMLGTWVNFWSGEASTRPTKPAAAIEASVDADPQALALAIAPDQPAKTQTSASGQLKFEVAKLADLPRWTAALAAGDLDGDGTDEIVALTDDEILAFAGDGRLLARRDHRSIGDSPKPSREPFGAISIQPPRIAYFSAARRRGEILALDKARGEFRVLGSLEEVPIAAQGETELWGSFVAGQGAFAAEIRTRSGERWSLRRPFWNFSLFARPKGIESLVVFADASAAWASGLGIAEGEPLQSVGAASALIDVDGDGDAEIVTTSALYRPEADELRVLGSPAAARASTVLWRGRIPAGWALQVVGARLHPGNRSEIVVGAWLPNGTAQLHVLRKVPP